MSAPDLQPERIVVQAPAGTERALEIAAIRAHLHPAEFAQRLLLDGLRANGFDLPRPARRFR